ncbi:hypothetical protein MTO96_021534 [Rhipicephalus appendiculatus]
MSLAESHITGSGIINLIPCTSCEGRLCHIFGEISLWNEYFWQVRLELRELSPGRLSLVEKDEAYVGESANNQDKPEQVHAVATLLHHLLTRHDCFASVAIIPSVFRDHHQLICDALYKSLSLAQLKLCALQTAEQSLQNIAGALLVMNHLRELEFQDMRFNSTFIDGLSEFLASTRSLTALSVTRQYFECVEDAVAFLEGLRRNQTITTLSFDTIRLRKDQFHRSIDIMVSRRCAVVLSDYFRDNRTLRTLSIGGLFTAVAQKIVLALTENKTLTKLNFVSLSLEDKDLELILRLLSQTRTLKSFNVIRCDGSGLSSRAYSGLAALTDNKSLEDLTLDLWKFGANEYGSLFKALASNPCLKKITVPLFKQADVAEICRAVRETGVQERFFIGTHYVLENTVDALTECKELSSVAVQPEMFHRYEPGIAILSLLPSCSHVSSLYLSLRPDQFKGKVSTLIAQCITDMTALRALELCNLGTPAIGDAFDNARRELAQALYVNKTIRRLTLHGPWLGETEMQTLADTLQFSGTLCKLSFWTRSSSCVTSLMRKLSPNIASNYTLLDMRLERSLMLGGDWFTVADVIRRNCTLVMRAAHFVIGRRPKYCAAAAELVQSNPGLVEKVQELASIDEDEAVSRIKKSLKSFSELDDFMRLAGVVKYRVTCHSLDDGQKQLVDIGRDGWLCIRQYIKVGDILDEQ